MTALPPPGPSLTWSLLSDGIPPSLLIDLIDPEGMRNALAAELTESDVARDLAPLIEKWIVRSA